MAWSDRVKSGAKDPCNVEAMLEAGVVGVLAGLLNLGCLVSFGVSRDGGSMSCTVTYNGAWDREWFRDHQSLHDWMAAAYAAIEEEPAPSGERSANGTPRRGR